jgi:hypothetical protein
MTSQGASQEQAEIYAESWEAARDKVTASLEQIYMEILDDDAFKGILNFFADLIKNIGGVVEAVGGLKGILNIVLGTLVSIGQKSIVSGIQSVGLAFRNMIPGVARKNAEETRQAAAQHA